MRSSWAECTEESACANLGASGDDPILKAIQGEEKVYGKAGSMSSAWDTEYRPLYRRELSQGEAGTSTSWTNGRV